MSNIEEDKWSTCVMAYPPRILHGRVGCLVLIAASVKLLEALKYVGRVEKCTPLAVYKQMLHERVAPGNAWVAHVIVQVTRQPKSASAFQVLLDEVGHVLSRATSPIPIQ